MDSNSNELKQIFQGQSAINDVIRDLQRKMDEIIGRQERSLSMLTNIQNSGGARAPGQPQVAGAPVDTIRRDEVNAVLANQREIVSAARDIKNFVADVHSKVTTIHTNQGRGQGTVQQVGGPGANSDVTNMVAEIRESLNHVKRDLANGYARMQGMNTGGKCPEVSCSSNMMLMLLLGGQLVVLISYMMYRDSKEAQSKKFY